MADTAPVADAPDPPKAGDPGATSRTGMAAERTWLAWWRTALAASAGALGVGRLAPEVLHSAPAPYMILGCGYALLAVGLLFVGARRQYDLQRATDRSEQAPLAFRTVAAFTAGGVLLAVMTVVLVLAQA
jgi:inner membrane protein YidH